MFQYVLRTSDVTYISKEIRHTCSEVDQIAISWNWRLYSQVQIKALSNGAFLPASCMTFYLPFYSVSFFYWFHLFSKPKPYDYHLFAWQFIRIKQYINLSLPLGLSGSKCLLSRAYSHTYSRWMPFTTDISYSVETYLCCGNYFC